MNTNRKFYSKPQTLRTQVALEQGMCAGSVFTPTSGNGASASAHETGFDSENGNTFEMTISGSGNQETGYGAWE